MKKVLIFLIKFSLLILFIYNLGIFQYLSNTEKHPPAPIKENRYEDVKWLNEIYQNALNLKKEYGPKEYFFDISQIEIKRKNNDFDRYSLPAVNSTITNLASLFHENMSNFRFREGHTKNEIAAYMELVALESDKCTELINPGITAKRKEIAIKTSTFNYWFNLFKKFIYFLFNQYLKNFFPALILLWLWWYNEQKTFKIKNPLSFLFCLIIYPYIVITKIRKKINNEARYLIMTANYRQRKHELFSLFSQNEINEIRKYAQSNISLRKYREILNGGNLIVRHNFVLTFSVSLLFFILNASNVRASTNSLLDFKKINQTEITQSSPPPYVLDSFIDYDFVFKDLFLNVDFQTFLNNFFSIIFLNNKCLEGFKKNIKHVPKLVVNNFNFILIINN